MDLTAVKIIASGIVFLLTILASILPAIFLPKLQRKARFYERSKAKCILSHLNCFAGGVFLATTLLDLFPTVKCAIDELLKRSGIKTEFAVAEFVITLGFFMIMLIEHIMLSCRKERVEIETLSATSETASDSAIGTLPDCSSCDKLHESTPLLHSSLGSEVRFYTGESEEVNAKKCEGLEVRFKPEVDVHEGHAPLHGMRSFVLMLSLSVHTLFDGLAIGLQTSSTQVLSLLFAVSVHKTVVTFSLSAQLAIVLSRKRLAGFMLIFAIMSPVGIVVGATINENISSSPVAAILQGFAAGIFLYVTFFEILGPETADSHSILKVLFIVLGYSLIAVLNLFFPA